MKVYKFSSNITIFHKSTRLLGIELDVKETDTDYNLEADMPGLGKQDIKLKINNNLLLISAERKMDVID